MRGEFDGVFAGERVWVWKQRDEGLIEFFLAIEHIAQMCYPRLERRDAQ
mgnify:CR=1 FL=1